MPFCQQARCLYILGLKEQVKVNVNPASVKQCAFSLINSPSNMLAKSILVATLASLLAVSNAAPVAQADAVTVSEEAGTSTGGRPIKWRRESDGAELCLQVNAITGPPEAQLRNGGLVGA